MGTHTSVLVVACAIISLTAILNSPPVSKHTVITKEGQEDWDEERTVIDHPDVLFLRWTYERISPEDLEALATVEGQELS